MAQPSVGLTRDRLVAAAVELFSTKGYEATSVADIQVACGLSPGSGALYKHFSSKRALLEEVLRRHVERIAADSDAAAAAMLDGLGSTTPDDLAAVLRLGAELVWQSMERDRAVIRITLRDLEPYPELLAEFWDGVVGNMNRQATQLIERVLASGRIDVADPEATAGVLMASLTYFSILEGLIGRTPGDLDAARYRDAWVQGALRALGVGDGS